MTRIDNEQCRASIHDGLMSETLLSVDIASRTSKKVQLSSVSLTSINASLVGRERRAGALFYREKKTTVEWSRSADALNLYLCYKGEIEVNSGDDDSNENGEPLGNIQLELHSRYELLDDVDSQESYHFAGIVGFMHAYPYIRAEVQGLTCKLGLPALTLGVLLSGKAVNRVTVSPSPESSPPALDHTPQQAPTGKGLAGRAVKRRKRVAATKRPNGGG